MKADDDWYDSMLEEYEKDGILDADAGEYHLPYPDNGDPFNENMNHAYRRGFDKRRRELGNKFEWK